MRGRFFGNGLGELPNVPLSPGGALNVPPALNRPPPGNNAAPTQQPGEFRVLGDNQSVWQAITFTSTIASQIVQTQTFRKFLLIQNKSAVGTMYIGFGYEPTENNALILPAGVGYEPYAYPVNEIYIASDIDGVQGLLIYGT